MQPYTNRVSPLVIVVAVAVLIGLTSPVVAVMPDGLPSGDQGESGGGGSGSGGGGSSTTGSVCTVVPGAVPGIRAPLWNWRLVNSGKLPQTVDYQLPFDLLRFTVEEGGARLDLAPNEMQIVLTSSVEWDKEIWASNLCVGKIERIIPGGRSMRIVKAIGGFGTDTIVFAKAGCYGVMFDVYHFDPNYFWRMFGGKRVTIDWLSDNDGIVSCLNPTGYALGIQSSCDVGSLPCIPLGTDPSAGEVYDTDNRADVAVWRPSTGEWFVINSSTGSAKRRQWGQPGDVPVPRDYDFDGRTDVAIWRPSTGEWWIIDSSTGAARVEQWGGPGDVPVPGDYDLDGKTDLAVWRPSPGQWWIKFFDESRLPMVLTPGGPGDVAAPGAYGGNRQTIAAVWRPSTGEWRLETGSSGVVVPWGLIGDVPVAGDYDADGKTDLAVWRPSTGEWYARNLLGSLNTMLGHWGIPGDVPVPRDYDGDGKTDLAIWRPSTGAWWIWSGNGMLNGILAHWGVPGDVPVPSK